MRLIGINDFIKSEDKLFTSFTTDEIFSNECEYLTTLLDKEYPIYKISERYHDFERQYTLGYTTKIGIIICNNGYISIEDKNTYSIRKGFLLHDKYVECMLFYDTSNAGCDDEDDEEDGEVEKDNLNRRLDQLSGDDAWSANELAFNVTYDRIKLPLDKLKDNTDAFSSAIFADQHLRDISKMAEKEIAYKTDRDLFNFLFSSRFEGKGVKDYKGLTPINLVVNWRSNKMKLIIDHKNKAVILMDGKEKVVVVCDSHDKFVPSIGFALVLSKYLDNKDLREVRKLFRNRYKHLDEKKYSAFVIGMLSNWEVSNKILDTQYLNGKIFKFAGHEFRVKNINKEEK